MSATYARGQKFVISVCVLLFSFSNFKEIIIDYTEVLKANSSEAIFRNFATDSTLVDNHSKYCA